MSQSTLNPEAAIFSNPFQPLPTPASRKTRKNPEISGTSGLSAESTKAYTRLEVRKGESHLLINSRTIRLNTSPGDEVWVMRALPADVPADIRRRRLRKVALRTFKVRCVDHATIQEIPTNAHNSDLPEETPLTQEVEYPAGGGHPAQRDGEAGGDGTAANPGTTPNGPTGGVERKALAKRRACVAGTHPQVGEVGL